MDNPKPHTLNPIPYTLNPKPCLGLGRLQGVAEPPEEGLRGLPTLSEPWGSGVEAFFFFVGPLRTADTARMPLPG